MPNTSRSPHHLAQSPSASRRQPKPVLATVDGQWINIADQSGILSAVRQDFRRGQGFSVHVLNLDHLVKRRSDPAYKDAYQRATYVTCDGAPVAALARRQHAGIQRTSGPDLIEPLCRVRTSAVRRNHRSSDAPVAIVVAGRGSQATTPTATS